MTRLRLALAILLLLPISAKAEEAFVDWISLSGSLPPAYAWSVTIRISAQGQLVLTHCKGYKRSGKDCTRHQARVEKAKLEAIRTAVTKADLVARPMREMSDPPIGGSTVSAVVHLKGVEIPVSGFASEADADRVGMVLRAIYLAIPESLAERYIEGD